MFMKTTYAVHAPALTWPEAAMLPALQREPPDLPRSLVLPDRRIYYPMPAPADTTAAPRPQRGSMAGRAVLQAVAFHDGAAQKEKGRA